MCDVVLTKNNLESCCETLINLDNSAFLSFLQDLREMHNAHDLADLIRAVQNAERNKLHATVALQSLRRVYHVENFSWQDKTAAEEPELAHLHHADCGGHDASETTSRLAFLNLGDGETPELGAGNRVDGGAPGEPTELEYSGAVSEATRILEDAVNSINEALEEIRYVQYDLEETAQ